MTRAMFAVSLLLALAVTAALAAEPKATLTTGDNPDLAVSTRTTPVLVTNFPAVQPVEGTVNVGNLPAVQQVEGAVAVSNLPLDVDGSLRVSDRNSTPTSLEQFITLNASAGCLAYGGIRFVETPVPPGGPWTRVTVATAQDSTRRVFLFWTSSQFPLPEPIAGGCVTTELLDEIPLNGCRNTAQSCGVLVPAGDSFFLEWDASDGHPRYVYLRWER